ncbi:hypothetical protein D3C85_1881630 [compost metagenome]
MRLRINPVAIHKKLKEGALVAIIFHNGSNEACVSQFCFTLATLTLCQAGVKTH